MKHAITREQYIRLMADRTRNLTDDPIGKRRDTPTTTTEGGSLLDQYVAKEMGE